MKKDLEGSPACRITGAQRLTAGRQPATMQAMNFPKAHLTFRTWWRRS